mmetsp:Transcript_5508/g.12969  ORF Transcript_5508/g.12969 Transcript_5508/m.12969 type:complete len:92 (+) Transcript_5508:105-380(+)
MGGSPSDTPSIDDDSTSNSHVFRNTESLWENPFYTLYTFTSMDDTNNAKRDVVFFLDRDSMYRGPLSCQVICRDTLLGAETIAIKAILQHY